MKYFYGAQYERLGSHLRQRSVLAAEDTSESLLYRIPCGGQIVMQLLASGMSATLSQDTRLPIESIADYVTSYWPLSAPSQMVTQLVMFRAWRIAPGHLP